MAHEQQIDFCSRVKATFPEFFKDRNVLDCGSLDVNGSNRALFENCNYIGIDIGHGKNVDIVCPIHEFKARAGMFGTIISTECFEHDMYWQASFYNIVRMLAPGGLLLFSCATTGRPEHGTRRTAPETAPHISATEGLWQDYYRNLRPSDYEDFFELTEIFDRHEFIVDIHAHDLYFWGFRRQEVDFTRIVRRQS